MSFREEMTFCLMGAVGGTLLRFPPLIWIEVKTLPWFESIYFKIIAHNFLVNSSVEMASFRRAIPDLQYALVCT